MKKEEKIFKAETKELLNLMIHSIYTNKEIFLRELISNANDAIDKLKFQSLTDTDILKGDDKFRIDISVDKDNRTLTVSDNGIGMTYEEVDDNIGTIAKSGSKLFKEQLEEAKKGDIDIIGQFGVGFYSGFIVADKITLETKSPYSENGVKWISSGDGNYEIEEISKQDRGTKITLHLKDGDEYNEFLEITCNSEFCCNISLEILSDRLSQSTSPEIKLKYSGIKSSHFSIINTFLV